MPSELAEGSWEERSDDYPVGNNYRIRRTHSRRSGGAWSEMTRYRNTWLVCFVVVVVGYVI